jgi:hypothetical protein
MKAIRTLRIVASFCFVQALSLSAAPNPGAVVAWGDDGSGESSVPVGLTNVIAIGGGGLPQPRA